MLISDIRKATLKTITVEYTSGGTHTFTLPSGALAIDGVSLNTSGTAYMSGSGSSGTATVNTRDDLKKSGLFTLANVQESGTAFESREANCLAEGSFSNGWVYYAQVFKDAYYKVSNYLSTVTFYFGNTHSGTCSTVTGGSSSSVRISPSVTITATISYI